MKIQVQYFQPVLFKENQRYEQHFKFYGTISLPALPPVGTYLWEFGSDDPEGAVVKRVIMTPEDGNPKRLAYEIEIVSDSEEITEWHNYDRWFKKKINWLFGLGLYIDDWPGQDDGSKKIKSFEQFITTCDKAWYDDVVSRTPT